MIIDVQCKASFYWGTTDTIDYTGTFRNESRGMLTSPQYIWKYGDGVTSNNESRNHIHTYSKSDSYEVSLIYVDTLNNCFDTFSRKVFVAGNCKADFHIKTIDRAASTFLFHNNSKGPNLHYLWNFGDGDTSLQESPTHSYSTHGSKKVTLKITDTLRGCISYDSTWLYVSRCCKININANPLNNDSTTYQLELQGIDTTEIENLEWFTHRTPEMISSTRFKKTFPSKGRYTVSAKLLQDYGCKDSTSITIDVGKHDKRCFAEFQWFKSSAWKEPSYRFGKEVHFLNKSIADDFTWTFGDGSMSTDTHAIHNYSKIGQYEVCLTANSVGCTDTICRQVEVGKECGKYLNISVGKFSADVRAEVLFPDKKARYVIEFDDSVTYRVTAKQYSYPQPGNYDICLYTQTDTPDCADTLCQSLAVLANPGADFSYVVKNSSNEVEFSNLSKGFGGLKFKWFFGDGNISHTFPSRGKEVVELHISNGSGSCIKSYKDQIAITGLCTADFTYYRDTSERDFFFTNTSTDTNLFDFAVWDFYVDNGFQGTRYDRNEEIYHVFQYRRNYLVGLAYQNTYGCIDTVIKKVNAKTCQAKFEFVKNSKNFKIKVVNQSIGKKLSYIWYFGDGDSSHKKLPKHTYSAFGTYELSLVVKNSGCTDSTSQSFSIDSTGDFSFKNGAFSLEVVEDSLVATNLDKSQIGHPLQAYPVPFADYLIVPISGEAEIDLIDIQGKSRQIRIIRIEEGYQLHTSYLPKGMYLIRVRYADGRILNAKALKE